jgi:hypothetical protein
MGGMRSDSEGKWEMSGERKKDLKMGGWRMEERDERR